MNNLGCDAVTELDNQKKSENVKKQKVKKNIMKKSSNKPLKSLSTPKTKSLKKILGAKSKKKTMANGDKVCFRLVTEPSEQKIVRLKAEALKKLYATKICAYCKQTVPSRQFKHHVKIHHPYRCAKCGLLFSNKEERLGHRREKHSSHQYHCIICNKIFDEKWHYGHHIKSLVHRNNREIYRRAINIMKSCIGLDLEDSYHTDDFRSTQKSLVPMEQSVNLFCSTEDVTLSYHEPEVQHLLNELSDVKSVMLNLVKSNSDFSFGQFTSSGQSSFFDCQIGRQVTQNFISDTVYSSEDAQFNDLTPCSKNASLISQNSLAIENNSSSSSSTLSFDDPSFRACLTSSSQQDSTGMPFDNPNFRACLTNVSQQNCTGMPFDNPSFRACLNNRSQQDSFGMPFENPNFRACLAKSSQQDRTGMPFENPSFRACPTITSQQDYTGMPFDDPNFRVCLTNTSQRDNTGMSIDDPSFRTGLSTHQANSTGLYFDDPNVRACLTANQPNSTGMSFDDPHFKACLTNNQPNSPGMSFDNPHFRTCLTNDTCFRACNTSEGKLQNDALSVGDPNLRSCQTKIRQPDIDKTTVISKTNGSPTNNDMLTDAFRLLEEEGYFENDQITSITSDIDLSEMVNNKEFTNLTRTPLVIEQKSYLPGEPIEQYPYLTGNQVEQNPNMPGIPEEQCPNLPGISEEQNPGMPGIPLEQYHNLSSIPVEKSQIDIINGNTESAENYSLLELSSHIPINAQPNIPMANFSDQQQHFNFDSNNNAVGENVQHQIGHNSDKVQCQIEQNGNVQCQNIEQFKAQGQNVYEDERRNVQDEYLAISQEIAQEEGMEF
ncbi:KRAB [Mytilus edulis]|uniref:KRAB n=1 Tax=Mytilus edulis TaxID=6550 RepID=A0A8S3V5P0_MYTED|nr:KRAB [Mytilus edulis]